MFLHSFYIESEAERDSMKREVQNFNKKLLEQTEGNRIREKEMQVAIDDSRRNEMKSLEKVKNLENVLENSDQVYFFPY